jgi:aspartyl/asparaginyl beta-hydroxylase (cupin superfamily)
MTTFFVVTGLLVWALVAFLFSVAVFNHPIVRRRLETKRLLPYTLLAQYRLKGEFVAFMARLGLIGANKVPREVVKAHRAIKLEDTEQLRDVLVEMDALPTIQTGKAAIGIDSMFELGTKKAHLIQSPYTHPLQYPPYLVPGVPARTFYEAAEFEWAAVLEREYPTIKAELMQLLSDNGAGFKGYMSEKQFRHSGWNTFNFFFYGKKFEENCERCPRTTEILESLPRFERDHIMFSSLNPHTRIPPHTGPMNGILRGHLGMIVPQGCYIRVGQDERTWQEGKVLVFDDSFEHEVWNHSDQVRIVLFTNFWHPCFSDREIKVLERFRVAYERGPLSKVHAQNQAAKRAHDMETARVKPAA